MRIAEFEQFFEFLGNDEDGHALIAQGHQPAADRRRSADIDAPGRLGDEQQLRRQHDLATDDELLQIAAGQGPGFGIGTGRADIVIDGCSRW